MQAGGREHDAASMAMGARLRERGEDSMVTNLVDGKSKVTNIFAFWKLVWPSNK
jgi:hypothetical protein